ncbi:MAG: TetR/AcrR family transcriptional regulator [Bacilli bacterium]|nr:TetR/AcrR family transcriptional regulator [Bacilli bacterium]
MNENDLRVIKTKKVLKDTLKQLIIEHNDFTTINVKELCEKAYINRRTFYLHYQSINDILSEVQEEFAFNYYNQTKQYDHILDIKETMLIFFQMANNNPVYEKIVLSSIYDYLRINIKKKTINYLYSNNNLNTIKQMDDITKYLIEDFYHSTTISCYRIWASNNKSIPLEKMVGIAADLIKNGLDSIIK